MELTREEKKELKILFAAWQNDKNENEVFEFCQRRNIEITEVPALIYSERQLKFIADALESGLKVSYDYCGRGMYPDICPAVHVEEMNDLRTDTKPAWDNMGFDYVLYVP